MSDIANLEIRLLLLKYGRSNVLKILARLEHQTLDEIEAEITSFEQSRNKTKTANRKVKLVDLAEKAADGNLEIAQHLKAIAHSYEGKIFLPNLRDANRFLERISEKYVKMKSRDAAGPKIIEALAKLNSREIENLIRKNAPSHESDYLLLSDAIMGKRSHKENH